MKSPPKTAWWVAGLFGLALGACWNGLANDFILDDLSKIVNNPDIRSLGALPGKLIYPYHSYQLLERNDPSRPFTFFIYALLYAIRGADPAVFHFANAALHGLAASFVFALTRRLAKSLSPQDGPSAIDATAGLAAALFAVAPIQVGTVTYAYGMSDVLSAVFLLASIWLFMRDSKPGRLPGDWTAAACFALALSCKQSAIVGPALTLAFDAACVTGLDRARWRARWPRYAPQLWVAGLYLAFRFLYFGGVGDLEGRGNTLPALDYARSQPAALFKYIQLTFWPRGLAIDHYLLTRHLGMGWRLAAAGLLALAVGAGAVALWRRRISLALGGFWYLAALAPTSSVFPTVDILVERRVYLANVGLFMALAIGARRWRPGRWALGALAAAFAWLSFQRNEIYRSNESAWRDVAAIYPDSPRALNNLANALLARHEEGEAKAIFEKLLRLYPSDPFAASNLATLYEREDSAYHDVAKAEALFTQAVLAKPDFAESYYGLARLLQKKGQHERAEGLYWRALEIKPTHAPALNNLGVLYMDRGETAKARDLLRASLRNDPGYGPALRNLAQLDSSAGAPSLPEVPVDDVDPAMIIKLYRAHLAGHPGDARARRGFGEYCARHASACRKAK